MSKYSNRLATQDGYTFDSQAERDRYLELKLLERAGAIRDLKVHPRILLQPAFTFKGKAIRAIFYEGDFAYTERPNNVAVIEDTKGVETEVFRIKHKLLLYTHPYIDFRIIKV